MIKTLMTLAAVCCLVTGTRAEMDSVCTVRYEGGVTVRNESSSYGTTSVLIQPTILPAIHRTASMAVYEGSVVLKHGSVDLGFVRRDGPGPGCQFMGTTSEDGRGTMRIEVDASASTPVITVRLMVDTKPREGVIKKCDGELGTTWYEHWFYQYKASYGNGQDTFRYSEFASQNEWYHRQETMRTQYHDGTTLWTVESGTTVDVRIGASPRVVLSPSRTIPLIPGVTVPTTWRATILYGHDTTAIRSAVLVVRDKQYPMTADGPQSFSVDDVDVAGEAIWQDTAVSVSVRAEMNDSSILDDSYWIPFVKQPAWLADDAVITRGDTESPDYVRYDVERGIRGGATSLAMKKKTVAFYDRGNVQPVLGAACGFGGEIMTGATGGSFHNENGWNGIGGSKEDIFTISMNLPDRVEFHMPVITLFRLGERKLELAYYADPSEGATETAIVQRSLGSLFGSMLDSIEPVVTPAEMEMIKDVNIDAKYDATLKMRAYFERTAIDTVSPGDASDMNIEYGLRANGSVDVNDYVTLHAMTGADVTWAGVFGTDSIRMNEVEGGSDRSLIVDVLGELTTVATESAHVVAGLTPIVQRPVRDVIPAMLLSENERLMVAFRQRGSARPVVSTASIGTRALVWAGREEGTGKPVVAVAIQAKSSPYVKRLDIPSAAFVHRPSAVFDGQNRLMVVWESAPTVPVSPKLADVKAFLPSIGLRWAVIDAEKQIIVDSGAIDASSAVQPQLHADADGSVHAFWKTTGTTSAIMHAIWNGSTWLTPRSVVTGVASLTSWNAAVRSGDQGIVTWIADATAFSSVPGPGAWSSPRNHGPARSVVPLLTEDGKRTVVLSASGRVAIADHDQPASIRQFGNDELGSAFAHAQARMNGDVLMLGAMRGDGFVVAHHEGATTLILSDLLPPVESYVRWGSIRWADDGTIDYGMATVIDNTVAGDEALVLLGRAFIGNTTSVIDIDTRSTSGGYDVNPGHRLTFAATAGTYEWYDVMGRRVHRMAVVEGTYPVCPELVAGTYFIDGPGYRGAVLVR